MDSSLKFIVYMGGCCGDLISALVDSRGAELTAQGSVKLPVVRCRFKKPHLFLDYHDMDQYSTMITAMYRSVPSHALEYHMRRNLPFIGIGVKSYITARWAADRFYNLHEPHVWDEMAQACGAESIDHYAEIMLDYTNLIEHASAHVIWLEDILDGTVNKQLTTMGVDVDVDLYQRWLQENNK